jgi:nicotinamide-nucleotide amidase
VSTETTQELDEMVEQIARRAGERHVHVATAESLTSGAIAMRLGAGPDASSWFTGGVVAYDEQVKFDVLGVPEGPVVTAECAAQMARGARQLLGADLVVAVTGVGGPDPSEGEPAGTVHLAVDDGSEVRHSELRLEPDEPDEVLEGTVRAALEALLEALGGR